MLTKPQLVTKFSTLIGSRQFIAGLTTAHQWSNQHFICFFSRPMHWRLPLLYKTYVHVIYYPVCPLISTQILFTTQIHNIKIFDAMECVVVTFTYAKDTTYVRTWSSVEAATGLYNSTAKKAVSFRANAVRSDNLMQC